VLHLQEAIDDLYDRIANLPELDKINVVFIKGLEVSLYEYEETMLKDSDERYKYPWSSVPRILGNLNFQRRKLLNIGSTIPKRNECACLQILAMKRDIVL